MNERKLIFDLGYYGKKASWVLLFLYICYIFLAIFTIIVWKNQMRWSILLIPLLGAVPAHFTLFRYGHRLRLVILDKNGGGIFAQICERKQILSETPIGTENIGVLPMRNAPGKSSFVIKYYVFLLLKKIPEVMLQSDRIRYQGGIVIHYSDTKKRAMAKGKEILTFIDPRQEKAEPKILEEMSYH